MRVRAGAGEARGAPRQQIPVVLLESREGSLEDPGVRDDDDIDALEASGFLAQPEYFSNQALRAIPADRIPQLLRCDDAEPGSFGRDGRGARPATRAPGVVGPATHDEQREELATDTLARVEDPLKLTAAPELPVLAETPGRRGGHVSRPAALRRGDREALSALRAAPLEHLTALLGAHAHEEPVGLRAAAAVWLERTLHGVESLATAA